MQIQQLRYLIASADCGSFRAAAQKLFVSQSSLSVAIKDLEQELGIEIFQRNPRGITLTSDGSEALDYARSIIEQTDLMEARYTNKYDQKIARFDISSQHYSLVTQAFGKFIQHQESNPCEFALHESYTNQIIRDVNEGRSNLGIIYLSNYNESIIKRVLTSNNISFTSLYVAKPHIVVHKNNPLAQNKIITTDQLSDLYRIRQEQGPESSSYYAEEPLSAIPHSKNIVVSDNSSLIMLLEHTYTYAIGSGSFPPAANLVAIPLQTDEIMNVGYICKETTQESPYCEEFLYLLCKEIASEKDIIDPSPTVFEYLKRHE